MSVELETFPFYRIAYINAPRFDVNEMFLPAIRLLLDYMDSPSNVAPMRGAVDLSTGQRENLLLADVCQSKLFIEWIDNGGGMQGQPSPNIYVGIVGDQGWCLRVFYPLRETFSATDFSSIVGLGDQTAFERDIVMFRTFGIDRNTIIDANAELV